MEETTSKQNDTIQTSWRQSPAMPPLSALQIFKTPSFSNKPALYFSPSLFYSKRYLTTVINIQNNLYVRASIGNQKRKKEISLKTVKPPPSYIPLVFHYVLISPIIWNGINLFLSLLPLLKGPESLWLTAKSFDLISWLKSIRRANFFSAIVRHNENNILRHLSIFIKTTVGLINYHLKLSYLSFFTLQFLIVQLKKTHVCDYNKNNNSFLSLN